MIIVTGGAGFIGSNIVKKLNNESITDIIIVDNLNSSKKKLNNIKDLKFSEYCAKEDFFNILPKINNIEFILHQGACSDTTESDVNYLYNNNYLYSKKILNFCSENSINLIYASSASVYGNGENGFIERSKCENPLNLYALSKLMFDDYVRLYLNKSNTTNITGLRYFNVFGYNESHKKDMSSVPYKMFNQAKNNNEIKLFKGSESFYRDFIFIEDVIDIVYYFMNNISSGIFNCGTGKVNSFQNMADIILDLKSKSKIKYINFPNSLEDKYQKFTKASTEKLKNAGYDKPFTDLKTGIRRYFNFLEGVV